MADIRNPFFTALIRAVEEVAYREGLRVTLAPRGIGVSVLCPGFIRTRIMESARAIPERLAGKVALLAAYYQFV